MNKIVSMKPMNNNTDLSANVKFLNNLFSVLYCFSPNEKYFHAKADADGNLNVSLRSNYASVFQNGCAAHVPAVFAWLPEGASPRPPRINRTYNALYFVRDQLKKGTLSDDDLRRGLKIINNNILAFSYKRPDGNHAFFTSYTKGTERYGKIQASQAQDYIKNHVDAGWQSFFLTLTCDTKKYQSRYDAWCNYKKNEVMPVLENMRKHQGLEYVGFMESTAKGYPHIHLVLFFPKGTFAGYDKMKNGSVLYYGRLFREIKKRQNSKISKLICLKGDNVKYYLTKYVTKDTESSVLKLEKKKDAFTQEERKNALGLIISKACAIRTKVCCKDRSALKSLQLEKQDAPHTFSYSVFAHDFISKSKRKALTPRDFARLRAVLIKLCTNSPLHCGKCIRVMSYRDFYDRFNADCSSVDGKNEKNVADFDNNSVQLGCRGCFFRSLIALVTTDYKKRFKNSGDNYESDVLFHSLDEQIDVRSNQQFFQRIGEIIDFYFNRCLVGGVGFNTAKIKDTSNLERVIATRAEDRAFTHKFDEGVYECVVSDFERVQSSEGVCFRYGISFINEEGCLPFRGEMILHGFNASTIVIMQSNRLFQRFLVALGFSKEKVVLDNSVVIGKAIRVVFGKNRDCRLGVHDFLESDLSA